MTGLAIVQLMTNIRYVVYVGRRLGVMVMLSTGDKVSQFVALFVMKDNGNI